MNEYSKPTIRKSVLAAGAAVAMGLIAVLMAFSSPASAGFGVVGSVSEAPDPPAAGEECREQNIFQGCDDPEPVDN